MRSSLRSISFYHNRVLGQIRGMKGQEMKKLVLLRHGESVWNKENRFTGWTDVDLSEKGAEEAVQAGQLKR